MTPYDDQTAAQASSPAYIVRSHLLAVKQHWRWTMLTGNTYPKPTADTTTKNKSLSLTEINMKGYWSNEDNVNLKLNEKQYKKVSDPMIGMTQQTENYQDDMDLFI